MTLRIAVPNKGRLSEPTIRLLRDAGLQFEKTDRALSVPVRNGDLQVLFVRADDVPELLTDGVADLGITGLDLLSEFDGSADVLLELGYGRCRLTAAVPESSEATTLADLSGLRVATSHPRTTGAFFDDKSIDATIISLRGSVEVAPTLDVADAIVDLVSSGSTMLVNGLRPIATILESQAVLAGTAAIAGDERAQQVVTMLRAVVAGRRKRYVLMNAPVSQLDAIEEIIPGIDSPSIVPLAHDATRVAVHSVVDADRIWDVLPRLEAAGATGVLVLPIDQLIP
ncbi:MAG: ATP phosphoribosyltransferase [Acidimicrobiia bacterium]|nr:ATP phosphoribosyltransferase [Acidimicrobiia bacterium]